MIYKNTGVGCHFLLQCMKVKSQSEVAQSCPTLRDPTPVVVFSDRELHVGGKRVRSAVSEVLPVCVLVDQPALVLGSLGVLTSTR